ncbi:hypothetical protein THRCLA_20712 [Thraustotheca clavata]|uniref:Uncharacterized protein n=1 Tax=Thraustotheca clavata TaxID=74557 RepID=A0A1W0A4C8_9STRA|nr:hypothetical protein THRCLA_20712 [Thraustotheca clavata]
MKYFYPGAPSEVRKSQLCKPSVTGTWSVDEHKRFLIALRKYPHGPWKAIAAEVGTRTSRQAQTHAQKFRKKLIRKLRDPDDHKQNMLWLVEGELDQLLSEDTHSKSKDLEPTFNACLDFFWTQIVTES